MFNNALFTNGSELVGQFVLDYSWSCIDFVDVNALVCSNVDGNGIVCLFGLVNL
jgi:hypothetical protein